MSRVFVIGAGCSFDEQRGYPLAKQFISELESFAKRIAGNAECQQIKRAIENTVELFTQCRSGSNHASTIDQLINLVLKGECDGQLVRTNKGSSTGIASMRLQVVRDAKIATAACFLEKEPAARQYQIDKYKKFHSRARIK